MLQIGKFAGVNLCAYVNYSDLGSFQVVEHGNNEQPCVSGWHSSYLYYKEIMNIIHMDAVLTPLLIV